MEEVILSLKEFNWEVNMAEVTPRWYVKMSHDS